MPRIQTGGDGDEEADVEIANAVAINIANPLPFKPDEGVGLSARFYPNLEEAGKGGNFDVSAKDGSGETNLLIDEDIIAVTLENFVGQDVN